MFPSGLWFFGLPVALYAALVLLPPRWGMPVAAVVAALTGIFALGSMGARPNPHFVDLETGYQAFFAIGLFGAALGGLGYQLVIRRMDRPWVVRGVFSAVAALAVAVLVFGYQHLT